VKSALRVALFLAIGFFPVAGPLSAHHGTAGYDMDKVVLVTGTVANFDWSNPHCLIHIDAKDEKGEPKEWIIELGAPTLMRRHGWTKDVMKTGDAIVAETHPAKNGAPTGLSGSSTVLLKFVINGHELPSQ